MGNSLSKPDRSFFQDICEILSTARSRAATAVNSAMVEAYWTIGKRIVEEEQGGSAKAAYGEGLIKELSRNLGEEFGKGFSLANLKNFRKFYLTYPEGSKGYTLCSFLSWSHNRLIMREEDEFSRLHYLQECRSENWSVRQLQRQIKTRSFQRLIKSQHPAGVIDATSEVQKIQDFIKDPYVLEFLQLPDNHSEGELEDSIIAGLRDFLMEMGTGFSFVARQMRISTETSHFYLDLVFYHYRLKCFVVIDLKTEKLSHQDIGQMDMYVRMFDDLKRGEGDNPTIGLILCSDKDETVVHYSVLNGSEQLFASKYRTMLPTEEELVRELERERAIVEHRLARGKDA